MAQNQRHIEKHPDGGWSVTKPDAVRVSSRHATQAQAQTRAKEILSHDGGGEAVTHRRDGTVLDSDTVAAETADWSLLSPQGHVLLYIALCPDSTAKDIARAIGQSDRQIWSVIQNLKNEGMLRLRKQGRRHHYSVNLDAPLLHPTLTGLTLRPMMEPMVKRARTEVPDFCEEVHA